MKTVTSIMISIFGNKNLNPDSESITYFMTEFKKISNLDFLPNIANSPAIDISTGNISQVFNLSFRTSDGLAKIIGNGNRIDFVSLFTDQTQDIIDERFNQGVKILQTILLKTGITANRLALNIDLYCTDYDKEKMVFKPLPFYSERDLKEFTSRINSDYEIDVLENKEKLNVITSFVINDEKNGGIDILRCHLDINTVAQNSDYRFRHEELADYILKTKALSNSLITQINGD